jgi:hypothetical protein
VGRTVGVILVIAGLAICAVVSLFIGVGAFAAGEGPRVSTAGAVLGVALFGVIPFLILAGVGVFLFVRGGQEAAQMADVQKQEKLLGMIQSSGKISVGNAAIEMKLTRDQIKDMIYQLVNQGLFSGYINWQEGMFYSKDLSQVQTTKCPNCGGQREVVGKGIVKCPYCGVELFIPQ